MTKSDAIAMFGTTVTALAAAVGVTRSAVSQWPEELRQDQIDRVIGAAVRLRKLVVKDKDETPMPTLTPEQDDAPLLVDRRRADRRASDRRKPLPDAGEGQAA